MRMPGKQWLWGSGLTVLLMLTACHTQQARNGTVYDNIQHTVQSDIGTDHRIAAGHPVTVPKSVSEALMPPLGDEQAAKLHKRRFNVTADAMPAKQFFMGLVEGTPINMVVNPDVTGNITLHLKNVTIDQAVEAVHDVYGYGYERTALGYEIQPRQMENGIFNVNYLDIKRKGKSVTELSSGQISEKITGPTSTGSSPTGAVQTQSTTTTEPSGSSVDTRTEMDFWKQLGIALKAMVGKAGGRSVIMNPEAGVVMVHAYPDELYQVGRYLDRIQSHMGRQVIIEAKILEVTLNDQFQSGINWNVLGKGIASSDGGMSQTAFPLNAAFDNTNLSQDFSSIFTLNAGKGKFNLLIQLLQTQGNVQVLSSPRLSTINNQKAVIKVGNDQFYVTGVSTDNTVTANSTIPTQNVTLTPFFSGVTFDVTPEISGDENITLHIHPSVSVVVEQTQTIQLGQTANNNPNTLVLPLAMSTIRESDNVVRARNGQIVVIGGLMQNTMREQTAGVPVVSKIPFVGALFRRTEQVAQKSELVILLRPIIVDDRIWGRDLKETGNQFERLKRGFHAGGLPEIFGNEGEKDPA